MEFYADLHIHSRFSRATSKDLTLSNLWKWAQLKGIKVIATGDFVHPGWLSEIKQQLEPAETGLFKLKQDFIPKDIILPSACRSEVRFILSVEVANIYKKDGKVRKIHNVIFVPTILAAEKIQKKLDAIGNIQADGRPILGLDSHDLLEIVLESDPLSFLVPAHIWTPWFSVLGSKGGFDSIEECFGDLTKYIFALETGLSSDPAMNWRLSQLDRYVLISNSDAHSVSKLGREATIFDTDLSYPAMRRALEDTQDKGLIGTVEFFPQEGKYHYDGHRQCKVRLSPKETLRLKGLCPVCGKPVTVGVMNRVEELADRSEGEKSERWRPYYSFIPLTEIIAECRGIKSISSRGIQLLYNNMLAKLGSEFYILRHAPLTEIEKIAGDIIAEGIRRMRESRVCIAPGYDGEYGTIRLFAENERPAAAGQQTLF